MDKEMESTSEFPYVYDPATRTLFALALKRRYEESGTWPSAGFAVTGAIADEYIQSPRRDELEIVRTPGGQYEIREMP